MLVKRRIRPCLNVAQNSHDHERQGPHFPPLQPDCDEAQSLRVHARSLMARPLPAAMPHHFVVCCTYRLVDFESEDSRLNEADGLSIDADETATFLDESDGGGLCRHQLFVSSCDFHRCRLSFD